MGMGRRGRRVLGLWMSGEHGPGITGDYNNLPRAISTSDCGLCPYYDPTRVQSNYETSRVTESIGTGLAHCSAIGWRYGT